MVYAAESDSLNLFIYRLNCDGDSSEYEDDTESKNGKISAIYFSYGSV